MNKKVFGGLTIAGASFLTGCSGDAGLSGDIEKCTPEIASTTEISDDQLGKLFADETALYKAHIVDSSSKRGLNEVDIVNVPGEAVCRLEDDSLVLTVSGLALQQALSSQE